MITTRCPACDTVFRVEPGHLKARQGKVRCGKCGTVFNALETLLEGPTLAPDKISVAPGIKAVAESAAMIETTPEVAAAPQAVMSGASETADMSEANEASETSAPRPTTAGGWLWGSLAAFALLVLLIQMMIVFRGEIALRAPQLKPQLLVLCAMFDCEIPLPRQADLISVETSDMLPDPQNSDRLLFTATLRNRAHFAQTYPHLELTLTDTADKLRLRRVFAPGEYLPAAATETGFAADADFTVSLHLHIAEAEVADTVEGAVAGYRIYIFYP